MKPNPEQQQFIREQLQSMLKVRETYEELYDHILTALEAKPEDVAFHDTVNQIINDDFSGKRGIKALQRREINAAVKEFFVVYLTCLGRCLTSYVVLAIIAATTGYYLLMQHDWFRDTVGDIIGIFINLIPATLVAKNTLKLQESRGWMVPKTDYALTCIKPFANILMINLPIALWLLSSIICHYLQKAGIIAKEIGHFGLPLNGALVLFPISVLHAFTYYQLYKAPAVGRIAK